MKYKVFVINPGSTSTKLALYENETQIACENVFHDSTILKQFQTINEQLPYRLEVIRSFIEEKHLDLSGLDAIVGRGGSSYSVRSGVYAINEQMIRDTREQKGGLNHVSNLGIQLAAELQKIYGGQILTLNPTVVDELHEAADFEAIGQWIAGARRWFMQPFTDRDTVPFGGLHAPSKEKMLAWLEIMRRYVPESGLRGAD